MHTLSILISPLFPPRSREGGEVTGTKNKQMKTRYTQLYELLTPLIIGGKLTTGEAANILTLMRLEQDEKEAYKRLLTEREEMASEHLELDRLDKSDEQ